jgi:hypothetical protein
VFAQDSGGPSVAAPRCVRTWPNAWLRASAGSRAPGHGDDSLHVMPQFEAGTVATRAGATNYSADIVTITVDAAGPDGSVNPNVVIAGIAATTPQARAR